MASETPIGLHFKLLIVIASCVFQSNTLSRIIYRVFDVDLFLTNHPSYGLVSTLTPDREGAMHIAEEKELVFNKTGNSSPRFPRSSIRRGLITGLGSILDCGKRAYSPAAIVYCRLLTIHHLQAFQQPKMQRNGSALNRVQDRKPWVRLPFAESYQKIKCWRYGCVRG